MPEPRRINTPLEGISDTAPLLHTKLMPPRIHTSLVARPELLSKLDESLAKKLTLVSAPTGFGKTTLVSSWLAEQKVPFAWVSLDENDNDPVRFWTYVITALRRLDNEIGKSALAALSAAQPPSFQTILTPLINELAGQGASSLLVLEDYQAITAADIHQTVAFLLQNVPDTLHLLVISRSAPDLPLGILRARDELLEIGAEDLRFSREEIEAFLRENVKGETLPSAVEKLQERTEGWAAGLRLAAQALQNRSGQDAVQVLESFAGSHRYVADYLIREVFANQPESIQAFLLKTCFLSRLTGALCDAVTESSGGARMLEELERQNLFLIQLEHGSGRSWYRYNPLFAESIRTLAGQRLGEDGVQSLYEKASAWYAYQQMYDEAVETALAAQLFERAIELVETFVEIYSLHEIRTLARWIENIPEVLILQHPLICLIYAQVILFSSDRFAPGTEMRLEPYLQAAEAAWQAAGDEARVGEVLAMRGMVLLWQGDFQQALQCVHSSLEKLPESEIFWRGVSLLNDAVGELYEGRLPGAEDRLMGARALLGASQNVYGVIAANGMMGEIFFAQGDLDLCIQINSQILEEAVGDESMLDDQGEARLMLARVAYERDDLETAARYAAEALDLAQRRANQLLQAKSAGCLALVRVAQGGPFAQAQGGPYDQAQGGEPAIEELKSLEARLQSPLARRELRQVEALLAVRAGEPPGTWLEANQPAFLGQKERETFIRARQRTFEGRPAEALALLNPFLADAEANGRLHSQAEALCLAALAHYAAGDLIEARQELARALTLGHKKGFRRLFLDEGLRMAALLRETLPALANRALNLYGATLLQLFPHEAASASPVKNEIAPLVEPLSQQEARVLKLLAAGLSNGEIARELVVSTNTVKTHVKSIYRKLNIRSREEARVMVKELKLM